MYAPVVPKSSVLTLFHNCLFSTFLYIFLLIRCYQLNALNHTAVRSYI